MNYKEFLKQKQIVQASNGIKIDKSEINPMMYEFQKDITRWALAKGCSALFEDCGLGKTIQQLEWSRFVVRETGGDVIIFAPLSVTKQTYNEGKKFGIDINICRDKKDVKKGINIANYEIMEKFDADRFTGIVLDESSILKNQSSKTRNYLIEEYKNTPFKLACTATPAPNDFMELGNHAEFLGVMSRSEMLSTFFIHDSGDTAKWRLKGHAEYKFWEWIASWACVLKNPADLGYEVEGYNLPELRINEYLVHSDNYIDDNGQVLLFPKVASTLMERRTARRESLEERCKKSADIANATDEQCIVWCDLNSESALLTKLIDGAVEVKGSDSPEHKVNAMNGFTDGSVRVLVSKPSIAGFGMNWQNCHIEIFTGLSDSFEMYYQAVRRCWRFGQEKPVDVYIVTADSEGAVKANIERKQADADKMSNEMVKMTKDILSEEIKETVRVTEDYIASNSVEVPSWLRSAI